MKFGPFENPSCPQKLTRAPTNRAQARWIESYADYSAQQQMLFVVARLSVLYRSQVSTTNDRKQLIKRNIKARLTTKRPHY
jgi:hypothetical protein